MVNFDHIKRVIPAPAQKRGKVAYMMAMKVGDAFYEDDGAKERYRRLRDYAQAKNKTVKFFVGESSVLKRNKVLKKTIVWRTA